MGDAVDPEVKQRIVSTVNQSLAINRDRVQVLDSTIISLYLFTAKYEGGYKSEKFYLT